MTAAEREAVRAVVQRTRAEQGLPAAIPPEACADVARILRGAAEGAVADGGS